MRKRLENVDSLSVKSWGKSGSRTPTPTSPKEFKFDDLLVQIRTAGPQALRHKEDDEERQKKERRKSRRSSVLRPAIDNNRERLMPPCLTTTMDI